MPRYDYQYTTRTGEVKVVERILKMSERTDTIQVTDTDGEVYTAHHVILTPHATHSTWRVLGTDSSLPPENSRALSRQDVPPTER